LIAKDRALRTFLHRRDFGVLFLFVAESRAGVDALVPAAGVMDIISPG